MAKKTILDYTFDVEVDDGPFAVVGFEESQGLGVAVEQIFSEGSCTEGSGEDGEVGFKVWVAVGVVGADLVAGEPEFGGSVEVVGQVVTSGLATGGAALLLQRFRGCSSIRGIGRPGSICRGYWSRVRCRLGFSWL